MSERPILSTVLKHDLFLQYYYLKEELIAFCKQNGLSTTGKKHDLTKRIELFLRTGEKLLEPKVKRRHVKLNTQLSLDSIIEENFMCTEKHRTFFKSVIGNTFSFNVTFQKYLKNSAGKTYSDAVNEWYKILEYKKKNKGKSEIESQFEYNTYIRDFFIDNSDKELKDAIICWKYKKELAGHNKYERQDLSILKY
ncbi:SAP domain-containing protein [Mobilitalea sibirica]|uniref:SAP domain-containing protein n=1 Tax=Mobilitalea sibirica TaxID=1462919 RepID=A0A8J7KWC5_9FIRM|nr:DUF6434 domain-containing protein [Mobilitalea sibirica]MBH1941200.1 SAP domain-containing protein [Mobilitalea sibirica]